MKDLPAADRRQLEVISDQHEVRTPLQTSKNSIEAGYVQHRRLVDDDMSGLHYATLLHRMNEASNRHSFSPSRLPHPLGCSPRERHLKDSVFSILKLFHGVMESGETCCLTGSSSPDDDRQRQFDGVADCSALLLRQLESVACLAFERLDGGVAAEIEP